MLRTFPFLLGHGINGAEFTVSLEKELAGQGCPTRQRGWLLNRMKAKWLITVAIPVDPLSWLFVKSAEVLDLSDFCNHGVEIDEHYFNHFQ